ncbi:MAG: [Ribosomal protein S18]-alanine N-acetyltransferase [Eubacteriales bacterium SKADARSKE-1]|nr:[Ribosomal protein S18]-alanine N-acetyltransferase [Eubacteriales bacterium SKADARSKE-1]
MEQTKIVKMEKEHIDKLADLEKICFNDPWSEDSLSFELTNKNAYFIVAMQNNNVLGYAGMHCVLDEGYIANVAVFPSFRKKGIGKELLRNILNYAEKNNFAFVTLEVRRSNFNAIKLYKNFGFEQMGIRKNFYKNPNEDAIIMTKRFIST